MLLIQAISQGSSSGFIYNTLYCKTGYFACLFCCLPLRIAEISRNSDYGFLDFLSKIIFGSLLHFLKNHGRYFLGGIKLSADIHPWGIVFTLDYLVRHPFGFNSNLVKGLTHKPLDRKHRVPWVSDCLAFGRIPNLSFTIVGKSHDRRRCSSSFAVCNNNRLIAFHHCNT